ncbi:MAG: hypothetical protein FWG59_02895 [Betaproteobacteria bacterium]|nr:hypothetical protein [Betaproteobacteria bacterium]
MALPKAVLCTLDVNDAQHPPEEAQLRATGFATASIPWQTLKDQRGWMQLGPVLDDPAVQAWVIAGNPEDFTPELRCQISLLSLSLRREHALNTAVVLREQGAFQDFPPHMKLSVFAPGQAFAGKLMAARYVKMKTSSPLPLHMASHLDPLIGLWLEIGPQIGDCWPGCMVGLLSAEITAFGIGARGCIPQKSVLEYPQYGIRGNWGEHPFNACAARNALDAETSCYIRVEGWPHAVFVTRYPDEEDADTVLAYLEFV